MSEDKKKQTPIEEGADEAEKVNAEDAGEKTEGEAAEEEAKEAEAKKAEEEAKKAEEAESERYMRLMAEFQNFKRRVAKEKSDIHAYANEKIVGDLLPVLDNFERALEMAGKDQEKKDDPFMEGMDKVYKQLLDELEKLGVKPIEALGADFDPNLHNAVMQEDTEDYESGKVCKELQKGYTLNDSVVRHSMVSVAK